MSQDAENVARNLKTLSEQLEVLSKKINESASLNGGFDRLVSMVEIMHGDIGDIKKIVLGDGEKLGVAHRVMQLESANMERNRYLENVVEPAFKEHQKIVFQMESLPGLIESDEDQKRELTLLKERVAILNKIMWLLGSGLAALLMQAVFKLIVVS